MHCSAEAASTGFVAIGCRNPLWTTCCPELRSLAMIASTPPPIGAVRKTGLVEGKTKNHTSRTVPVTAFLARLLETGIADRDQAALVFPSARSNN